MNKTVIALVVIVVVVLAYGFFSDSTLRQDSTEIPGAASISANESVTAELGEPSSNTITDPFELEVREAIRGTPEFLAARQKAEDIYSAEAIQPTRAIIAEFNYKAFAEIKSLAERSNGRLSTPLTITLFPDLPCTFSEYRMAEHKGASFMISAACDEYFDSSSIRVSVDSSDEWSSIRLVVGPQNYRFTPVSAAHAAVYEYIEPTPEEKQRARQNSLAQRGSDND